MRVQQAHDRRTRIRRQQRQPGHEWERQTEPTQWIVRLGPQHGPTGQTAANAVYENPLVPLEEEQRRTAVMHINLEHAGEVLVYMDAQENPLRYALHRGIDEAMRQAQIEYGVAPTDWETLTERLPWKDRYTRRSRRSRKR